MSDDLELVPAAAPAKPPVRRERRSFVQDMADPKMFGPWFSPDWSWYRWKIAAKVLFGEELESAEKTTFEHLTGRRGAPPSAPMKEAWFIVGRWEEFEGEAARSAFEADGQHLASRQILRLVGMCLGMHTWL